MKLAACILAISTLLFPSAPSQAQSPLIGIFEGNSSGAGDGQGKPGVRVLFYQSGQQWRAYNAACKDEACLRTASHLYPPVTTWNLIKSGKPILKVTATTPSTFHFYSEIGVQAITSPATIANLEPHPKPGEQDPPRTILATTLPTLTDPDNWHPVAIFPLDLTHVRQAFRRSFPHPFNCNASGQALPKNQPWAYTDADIKLNTSLISNKNWRLIQVTLGGYLCDGPPDADFADQWFAIAPTGEIHHLGRLMQLVGAADFAHEGHSELLFSNLGDNDGGYKLFYDNFTHQTQAIVTLH